MDDRQPPKKKSRLFSEGKVLLNSLLHRNTSKSKTSNATGRNGPSGYNPAQFLIIDVAHASAPMSTADSTRVTPTATAFQGLSVDDRSTRPKAIYGTQDLLDNVTEDNGRTQHERITKYATSSVVPWMSAVRQHEVRQGSQLNDAVDQTQFTFRAASQPEVFYPQAPQKSPTKGIAQATFSNKRDEDYPDSNARLVRTPILSALKVPKQRRNLPAIPESPKSNTSTGPPSNQSARSRTVDVDRDTRGERLTSQPTSTGFTNLPLHATASPVRKHVSLSKVPENALTSPGRVERASSFASKKRKRGAFEMPPPAYVYTRTNDPNFTVFQGILLYPELCFHLASHLPVEDLISLYAISRDYHTILDTRFTTVILSQALKKAPRSSHIFPFRSYAQLCRKDPAARIPHPDPKKAAVGTVRLVPSFRWLKMIMYREKTVHAIMAMFAERGIPLPRRCGDVLKKLWFMLDIPDNARRIGFIHNSHMMNDLDLYFAACFFVKLDMLFTDPVSTHKRNDGRRMILSQQSLTKLLQLLKGEAFSTRWQIMQAWVEWKYDPVRTNDDDEALGEDEYMFGIPKANWGRLKKEYWGRKVGADGNLVPYRDLAMLLRPDQLVVREAVRRGMTFAGHYIRFMLYGYVHPKTMKDFDPREMTRMVGEYNEDDYTVDDMVAGAQALSVEDGGCSLDLGPKFQGGRSISRPQMSKEVQKYKEEQQEFIDELFAMTDEERRQ